MSVDHRPRSLEDAWLSMLDKAPELSDPRSKITVAVLRVVFMAGARAAVGLAGQGDLAAIARDLNAAFPKAGRVGGGNAR